MWSQRARDRIAGDIHLVDDWQVLHGSYELAPPADTYFVDPPYVDKGRYYRFRNVDYPALASWCRALPDAIVCEQAGASWMPFEELATIKSTRGTSAEVVWMSARAPITLF